MNFAFFLRKHILARWCGTLRSIRQQSRPGKGLCIFSSRDSRHPKVVRICIPPTFLRPRFKPVSLGGTAVRLTYHVGDECVQVLSIANILGAVMRWYFISITIFPHRTPTERFELALSHIHQANGSISTATSVPFTLCTPLTWQSLRPSSTLPNTVGSNHICANWKRCSAGECAAACAATLRACGSFVRAWPAALITQNQPQHAITWQDDLWLRIPSR